MDKREIANLFRTHGVTVSDADVWEVQKTPRYQALGFRAPFGRPQDHLGNADHRSVRA